MLLDICACLEIISLGIVRDRSNFKFVFDITAKVVNSAIVLYRTHTVLSLNQCLPAFFSSS